MANPKPNNGWEDKKRPMFRNDTSISKRPRLDVRVVSSSSKSSTSPLKTVSPPKSFKRSISLPSSSRDSPSPTDAILLSAAEATEEAEAKAVRELGSFFDDRNQPNDWGKKIVEGPATKTLPTTKAFPSSSVKDKTPVKALETGNNGSSGFDRLFSDEISEDFVEECMNLATALSQQPKESSPPPMSQAYEYFFKGVKSHSSILEKNVPKTVPTRPVNKAQVSVPQPPVNRPLSTSSTPSTSTSTASTSKLTLNTNKHSFRKPQMPTVSKPVPTQKLPTIPEGKTVQYPAGAEAVIRKLELEVERLTIEKKEIKEAQNTKDGEAAVLRFQVQEGQNKMKQLKASHDQAISVINTQFNEKIKNLQKDYEKLRSQLHVQVMENNSVRERSKLLESSNSRVRLVEPQSPSSAFDLNLSMSKAPKSRKPSAFLNRSTFEENLKSPPKPPAIPSTSGQNPEVDPVASRPTDASKVGLDAIWHRYDIPKSSVGCALALRLAGWETIEANDFDDSYSSYSARRVEYDTESCLDILKGRPVPNKRRTKIFSDKDRPGLAACVLPLRTVFRWPEPTLESPAAQDLLRKVAVECCGLVHYKFVLLKDLESEMDEKTLYKRDCDIVERGGEVLDLEQEMDLLDDRPWHKGEHGVSSRRALGLLSELAFFSNSFSALLTGSLSSCQPPLERHTFTELPDFADCVVSSSQRNQSTKDEQQQAGERMDTDEFQAKSSSDESNSNHLNRYWFLEILADLCLTIAKQKRTNQFNGVFVGVLRLLENCARNKTILGEARPVVLRIIRGVVLARPSFYTLRCLLNLLEQLSDCQDLMAGLCSYDDHDNYQEDLNHKLFYFRSDSCILQLLCAELNAAGKSRWYLADPMVRWLLAVFAHTTILPRWLVPHITSVRQDGDEMADSGKSLCCPRIISTAVTLSYEAFQLLKEHIEREGFDLRNECEESESRGPIPKVMQRALVLLHTFVVNDLSEYMGRVEGDYDIFIPGLNRTRKHLDVAPNHDKLLDDLVRIEEDGDDAGAIDSGGEDLISENVWDGAIKSCVLP